MVVFIRLESSLRQINHLVQGYLCAIYHNHITQTKDFPQPAHPPNHIFLYVLLVRASQASACFSVSSKLGVNSLAIGFSCI